MRLTARDLAYGGLFGAVAFLLPVLFHLVRLGHLFMPMYPPLVVLAFLTVPRVSATTALIVPILSGLVTGMPPFYPPIAPVMAVELAVMALLIGLFVEKWPRIGVLPLLVPILLIGRVINVGLSFVAAQLIELPPGFVAGLSLLSGWPGLILLVLIVPPLVGRLRARDSRFLAAVEGGK